MLKTNEPGGKITPLMRQYWDVKSAHPDKIILFRMGDFFEMFHDDAVKAAPIIGITLTKRNPKDETPMCGVPHHSVAGPIQKLLSAGLKIAICEQLEDPATAKGLVKRGVVRVLTPGMVYDPETIASDQGLYISCLSEKYLAFADASSGEGFYFELDLAGAFRILSILHPVEIISEPQILKKIQFSLPQFTGGLTEIETLPEPNDGQPSVCVALSDYIQKAQGGLQPRFEKRNLRSKLALNPQVTQQLEIFSTYRGEKSGSLFHTLDRTETPMGSRQLRRWLSFPETDATEILRRQDKVQEWMNQPDQLIEYRTQLKNVGDMERRLGRLFLSNCNARDLKSLALSIKSCLELRPSPECQKLLQFCYWTLGCLKDELPLAVKEGGFIRKGVNPNLDELITLTSDHTVMLQEIEQRERESTRINSLKVKYNAVFGYFIEITHNHKDKVPPHYVRRQTIAQAERFTTDELIHLEERILSAKSRREVLEYEIFTELRQGIQNFSKEILELASQIAELDVHLALAWVALERSYVRPSISSSRSNLDPRDVDSRGVDPTGIGPNSVGCSSEIPNSEIELLSSRHPVLELLQRDFISNDIVLNSQEAILLTGPNMAGKSTLMRQLALSCIMMQIGSFIPARKAKLPVFNSIHTRIGSSDSLSEGLSTFMVEMKEASEILKSSDQNSLVILDEIGRGTATFDGMSLARAIIEHLHSIKRATVLFATHYHELTDLEGEYPRIFNYHMQISERSGEVKFLYKLKKGAAGKSIGIHVAELAGLPTEVLQRAREYLKYYENSGREVKQLSLFEYGPGSVRNAESLFSKDLNSLKNSNIDPEVEILRDELSKFDVNNETPMAAMMKVSDWKIRLTKPC